jgi:crotonobetainyl-CoA:carnitine CoA-transferase CaiB-like acyl-CoA transferase
MPVMDLYEAWGAEHVQDREMRLQDSQGNDHLGIPIKYKNEPGSVDFKLHELGEHTSAILADLGYSAERIAELKSAGAI